MALIQHQVWGGSAAESGGENPGEHTWKNTLEAAK